MLLNLLNSIRTCFSGNGGINRRRHKRHRRCTLITLQILDDDLSTIGKPFWGMSNDFGHRGLGFTCSQPITHTLIRITIPEDSFSAIASIRYRRANDDAASLYLFGAEFIDDFACHER